MHSERYRVPADVLEQCRQRGAWSRSARPASARSRSAAATGELEGARACSSIARTTGRSSTDDDQLPPAADHAADDDRRVRRRSLAAPVRHRARRATTGSSASATRCCSIGAPPDAPRRFETVATDGAARAGVATTARGSYRTPCFMPVGTRGAIKYLSAADYADLGAEIVLGNTYHLMLRPGADVVEPSAGSAGSPAGTG